MPLDIVNKLFASPITKQVNVQITQNADSAVLYAIVQNGGEHADGSVGYAEFNLHKPVVHVTAPTHTTQTHTAPYVD